MSAIQWGDPFNVNHPQIDAQHQKWISICNKMHSILLYGTRDEIGSVGRRALQEMMDSTCHHFHPEEDFLRLIGYPGVA